MDTTENPQCHLCTIIPPRILRAIAANATSEEVRRYAERTLTISGALRQERALAAAASHQGHDSGGAPPRQGFVPPHVLRAIADSATDPAARAAAEHSIAISDAIRAERAGAGGQTPLPHW